MAAATAAVNFRANGRKIIGVGRNYAEHAKELGNAVPQGKPLLFLKPTSSYVGEGEPVAVPEGVECHHEVELAVVIGEGGQDIRGTDEEVMSHVAGYALALDMTARNVQSTAKGKGHPWSEAKGYDTFCPISEFVPVDRVADPHDLVLSLQVDGETKQEGSTGDMIFRIPFLVQHISSLFTLETGDVILTGTPAGVSQVVAGQTMVARLASAGGEEIMTLTTPVVDRTIPPIV